MWERHITALEDPEIREVALNGPDTATRSQTFWQVKLLEISDTNPQGGGLSCWDDPSDWTDLITATEGSLSARANGMPEEDDPCVVPASAGYRNLENQLYRVEIHRASDIDLRWQSHPGTATFKWSRDNGIVVTRLLEVRESRTFELVVADSREDTVLGFAPGQWVEASDEGRVLRGEPGILVRVQDVKGQCPGDRSDHLADDRVT